MASIEGLSSRVAVIDIVGLCRRHLEKNLPRITVYRTNREKNQLNPARPSSSNLFGSSDLSYR